VSGGDLVAGSGAAGPARLDAEDVDRFMRLALGQARAALALEEIPVGAVVVQDGRVLGRGHNRTITDRDPTAHAEVVALREAARAAGNHRLPGAWVVATLEPCLLCCGALVQARVTGLVHAADDKKAGALHVLRQLGEEGKLNHRLEPLRSPCADEAGELLREFFRQRRGG